MKLNRGFSKDAMEFEIWLGKYLTTPLRRRPPPRPFFLASHAQVPGDEEEEEDDENEFDYDALYIRGCFSVASQRIFDTVEALFEAIVLRTVTLRRAEGTKMIFIEPSFLFCDGEVLLFFALSVVVYLHAFCGRYLIFSKMFRFLVRC